MTRAPQSARCRLARGAAIACSSETTVTPDSGSSASCRSMQSFPLPLTLLSSAGDKPTTPRTFCDDGIMLLFCPTSQIEFRKIRKTRSAKFNSDRDLATVHGVVFAVFVLGALLPRPHTSRLSHLASVANDPPFTHYSLRLDIWGDQCRRSVSRKPLLLRSRGSPWPS